MKTNGKQFHKFSGKWEFVLKLTKICSSTIYERKSGTKLNFSIILIPLIFIPLIPLVVTVFT